MCEPRRRRTPRASGSCLGIMSSEKAGARTRERCEAIRAAREIVIEPSFIISAVR